MWGPVIGVVAFFAILIGAIAMYVVHYNKNIRPQLGPLKEKPQPGQVKRMKKF